MHVIESSNVESLAKFVSEITHRGQKAIRKAFHYIGKDLVKEASKSILMKPKHGRIYKIKRRGRTIKHRASSPDEAPANFSGDLRKSLDFKVHSWRKFEFGANTPYAAFLELGTKNMARRTYLIRAVETCERNMEKYFKQELLKEFNKK